MASAKPTPQPPKSNADPQKPPEIVLSRLDSNKLNQPKYLAIYWNEHADNFSKFILDLIDKANFLKLLAKSREIVLLFNRQSKLVPLDFSEQTCKQGYLNLEKIVSDDTSDAQPNQVGLSKGKQFVLDFMQAYFEVLWNSTKSIESTNFQTLRTAFPENQTKRKLDKFAKDVLQNKYEAAQKDQFFYPQLFTYFVQLIEIYDQAMQGKSLISYVKQLDQMRKDEHIAKAKNDPGMLKQLWDEISKEAPFGPLEPFNYDANPEGVDLEPSNPQFEEEISQLQDAAGGSVLDLKALWGYKGDTFKETWVKLPQDDQRKWILLAREITQERVQSGIMYLPELNDTDLLKDHGKAALSLIELCSQFSVSDVSQLDPFTTKIANYMKSKGKQSKRAIATIIYTRRLALTIFCVNLVVETLGLIEEQQKEKEEEEKKKKADPNYANQQQNSASATSKPISMKDISEQAMKKLNETKGKQTRDLPTDVNQEESDEESEEEEESKESGITEITDEEEQKAKKKQAKKQEQQQQQQKAKEPPVKPQAPTQQQQKPKSDSTQKPTQTQTQTPTTPQTKCSEPSCGKVESDKFLICGGCKKQGLAVAYCSRECQIKHWPTHKQNCGSKK